MKIDTQIDDLDRTDELQRLDLRAYEASLRDVDQTARTDNWAVQTLRQLVSEQEAAQLSQAIGADEADVVEPSVAPQLASSEHVGAILDRIADLESQLVAAKSTSDEFRVRCVTLSTERVAMTEQLLTLQSDNASLLEQRAKNDEAAERLEQQLRDQAVQTTKRFAALEVVRTESRDKLEGERKAAEERIAEHVARASALAAEGESLRSELRSAIELAATRADSFEELRTHVDEEKSKTTALARQLASKVANCENLGRLVDQRNQTIVGLRSAGDVLTQQLEAANEQVRKINGQLRSANDGLELNRKQLGERAAETANREGRIAQLTTEIDRISRDLWSATEQCKQQLKTLAERDRALQEAQTKIEQQTLVIAEQRAALAAAAVRADSLQAQIDALQKDLSGERLQRQSAAEDLQKRDLELEATAGELANAQRRISALRKDLSKQSETLSERAAVLETANRTASELQTERDSLRANLADAQRAGAELQLELRRAQEDRAAVTAKSEQLRARMATFEHQLVEKDDQIATLESELAVSSAALAAIRRDLTRVSEGNEVEVIPLHGVLEPIDHDGEAIQLNRKLITIGRTSENDVCIPSRNVSRHHARLLMTPNGLIIEDAGSTNGCLVNGSQVKQQLMQDGDVLELGGLRYRLNAL